MLWVPNSFCPALGWFRSVEMYSLNSGGGRGSQSVGRNVAIEYAYLLVEECAHFALEPSFLLRNTVVCGELHEDVEVNRLRKVKLV